ncbi:hypothetical protein SD72_02100 [Leucobacter komagatae]|uniref:FMN phosphatase YigB (HAD superfamily) n=1 Tax=Leucobacter komagatae TaxID=55969 RepID=A0A0D0IRE1_9MICO|nr:hypothetical protein SD72_02100 [Leucobacter komagatae]
MDSASTTGGRFPTRKATVSALPVLIFDFDGTVSLGDGPVRAYAQAVAAAAGAGEDLLSDVARMLSGELSRYVDGYDLVRQAALEYGLTDRELSRAYLESRDLLATVHAPIAAPSGLEAFLRGADADRVLITNAPDIRIDTALETLGLAGLFDTIITDAGKPAGMATLLDGLGSGKRVLSVGDVWENDLEPASARGHATALVGAHQPSWATPDFSGTTVTDVLPDIARWLIAE